MAGGPDKRERTADPAAGRDPLLPVSDASARIFAALTPTPPETVPFTAAWGRVLAEAVTARRTQPPFAASAMDGYAVRAADVTTLPATLRLVGESAAGRRFDRALAAGDAVRIFTGAPVPAGADTIALQEDATRDGATVTIAEVPPAGKFIRPEALDFHNGARLFEAGRAISPADVALLASAAVPFVSVHRRPRVAVLATGDELVLPGVQPGPDQIIASNVYGLAAQLQVAGAIVLDLGIAVDTRESLRQKLAAAAGADLLITLGGASVGEHDLVADVFAEAGMTLDFWRIAMRPGKPLMFGQIGGMPVLGLPGNPVSSLVCATLFALPAIARLMGIAAPTVPSARARLAENLPANDERQDYLRATIEQRPGDLPLVKPFARQDSSMLATLAAADALIVRAPFAQAVPAGTVVEIVPLR